MLNPIELIALFYFNLPISQKPSISLIVRQNKASFATAHLFLKQNFVNNKIVRVKSRPREIPKMTNLR